MSNTNIEKFNLQNIELISNSNSASLLNKYLDEILYFFERTSFDVVVFQDLDRFRNLNIFTKLRELNNFINNSEQVNRKVVFIYAVRDEMFKNALERTKFFDFLIPVIPYINTTNSKDILFNNFKNVSKSFLYDISLYISDMRLVKNIYNEYFIYSNKLNDKLDKSKLLAMIIYKNFEPQDFEELHKSKGIVYSIFHFNKKENLNLYIQENQEKINNLQKEIEAIEKEPRKNIQELRKLYILDIIEKLNGQLSGNIIVDGQTLTLSDCLEDDNFKLIKKSNNICSKFYSSGHYAYIDSTKINFKTIEQHVGNYDKREEIILDKMNNKKNKLQKEIEHLKTIKEQLKYMSLKEFFENFPNITIFENMSISFKINDKDIIRRFENEELMKYLLSYGHIDENYEEYISNFFDISISKHEQDFLRNVKSNGNSLAFDYELHNLEEIVTFRLNINEFKKTSILNIHLIEYLLQHEYKHTKQIEKLFKKLSDETEISKEFILYYLNNGMQKTTFIKNIVKFYPNFLEIIVNQKNNELDNYFNLIIKYAEYNDIRNLNYKNCSLSDLTYIETSNKIEVDKVINLIKDFNLKFTKLKLNDNPQISNLIFEKNHYELNLNMINEMIFNKCIIDNRNEVEKDLQIAHFTTITSNNKLNDNKKIIIQYILDNINEYIENVFLKIDTNTQESEETIIEILNNPKLDDNLKYSIIKKIETIIIDIDRITDIPLWEELIKYNKVAPSWDNAFKYFREDDADNNLLLTFLNIEKNSESISKIRCDKSYSDKNKFFTHGLLRLIIQTNSFSNNSYENIIKNLEWWYNDLDIKGLDKDKISLLIKYNRFQFNKESFNLLKEHTNNLHIELLVKNKTNLLDNFEEFDFTTDDIFKILEINDSVISNTIKKALTEKINYKQISNKNIANMIYKYTDKSISKPFEYVENMLNHLESIESKINLLVEQNNNLNDEEFIKLIGLLPEKYSKIKNHKGKQTILKNNYYNQKFIEILKQRKLITSSKSDKEDSIRLYIKEKK